MKGTEQFGQIIKQHLDERAASDEQFAEKYANEKKSIKECCDYIISKVKKTGKSGFADDEIFGMAIHYYDEANITAPDSVPGCRIVTNQAVELTAEEKEKAKRDALARLQQEEYDRMKKKNSPKPKATPQFTEQTLFDFD